MSSLNLCSSLNDKSIQPFVALSKKINSEFTKKYNKAFNANVAVDSSDGTIKLLYKVNDGPGERSFGIHVASIAGLPLSLINRANDILKNLEKIEQKGSLL
ncbi:MutS-related protein [Candidatus Similichlamydia epinepheli]|uniref:MutS-related protein n=1 Tax=Candidatus Similichlamydia epinepheli TaxID=1903953 RepID=UPI000D3A4AEF|nr:hypothetical protein [Candidatus Similichlamydia epinepheli]